MSKSPHTPEWQIETVKEYLSGHGSYGSIAGSHGISKAVLQSWVQKYSEQGAAGFLKGKGNAHYSKAFKTKCVQAVISGEGSVNEIVAKYNISSRSVLYSWIKRYNANKELKDYEPRRDVYMANARRKTTLAERKEITEYCIAHGKDYKGTAAHYELSYSQVYSWVSKYEENGIDALTDRRGHHKTDDEVDELERLRRENKRLKRQLEESKMLAELLKKVKEFERM